LLGLIGKMNIRFYNFPANETNRPFPLAWIMMHHWLPDYAYLLVGIRQQALLL